MDHGGKVVEERRVSEGGRMSAGQRRGGLTPLMSVKTCGRMQFSKIFDSILFVLCQNQNINYLKALDVGRFETSLHYKEIHSVAIINTLWREKKPFYTPGLEP